MSWLRVSDTASSHPRLLAVLDLPDADEMLTHLVFSFVSRCFVVSSQKRQDYLVTSGQAREAAMGQALYKKAVEAAVAVGLMTEIDQDEATAEILGTDVPGLVYRLMDDQDFMHMRTRAEIEWDAQRKRDNRNADVTAPVRARDGDACRYCGKSVQWGDGESARGATFDHLHPGKEAEGVDDLVVCCRSCNASKGDGDALTLLPAPAPKQRLISKRTADWLTAQGIPIEPSAPEGRKQWNAQAKASEARADALKAAHPGEPEPEPQVPAPAPPSVREKTFESLRQARARNISHPPAQARETPTDGPEEQSGIQSRNGQDVPRTSAGHPPDEELPSLDCPGRDGPGRAGSGLDGPGRVGSGGRLGSQPRSQPPRRAEQRSTSRKKRRKKR